MADTKISALTSLTGANVDSAADVLAIVDTSVATTKKITRAQLFDISDAAGGQIVFPASQNASAGANTLDDYEEGTWTPAVGGTATYTTQNGYYTKIGRLVTFSLYLNINVLGTGSNNTITGLPFTSNSGSYGTAHVGFWSNLATTYVFVGGYIQGNSTTITLTNLGVASATVGTGAVHADNSTIIMSGFYYV